MSLEARNITVAYQRRVPVLSDVSLSVAPGERVAVCAPSGRGKTTLCRVLAGYLRPRAGTVRADDEPVVRRAARGPRPVQLIWQHPEQAFDPLVRLRASVAEGAPAAARGGRARESAFERVRASGLFERFGIREAWLERYPHELSGGELMRFCMVRALLAEPRYLICDEMTAMLDAVTQAELWHAVLAIADERGMGLVIVSHSPALVRRIATRTFDLL